MTDARAAAVEAAALAFVNHNRTASGAPTIGQLSDMSPVPCAMSGAITAYLARMAEAGWVMVRDVGEARMEGVFDYDHGRMDGWNACRAAMLGSVDTTTPIADALG